MMSRIERSIFKNPFEAATRGNYPLAIFIGKQQRDSLFIDSTTLPIAKTCYDLIAPKVTNLENAEADLLSQKGTQGGKVATFKQLEEGMSITLDGWQSEIKHVYKVDSIQYHVLFPNGKGPFTKGTQQHKIDAVLALLKSIGTDASLATTKVEIQAFYDAMTLAFKTKGTSKRSTINESIAVEVARKELCDVMEGNFGKLIDFYFKTPMLAAKYFDEPAMHGKLQKSFMISLNPLKTKNVFTRTFANPETQELQFTNLTTSVLRFFLTDIKTGLIGTLYIEVPAMATVTRLLSNCGDPTTQIFLKVMNIDLHTAGKCRVKVL